MKPGWVAGVTRARLMLSRALGAEQSLRIATCPTLEQAVSALAPSAYGERVRTGADLDSVRRGVADTLLWHLRVLAGWLPPAGTGVVRALAAWFELQNIDARLAALAGERREPGPFELGSLATAWPRLEQARTTEALAAALAASAWGDPGGHAPAEISLGVRVEWVRRVHAAVPEASGWAAGAGALLIARERFVAPARTNEAQLRRLPGVGDPAMTAGSIAALRAHLDPRAAWALAGIEEPHELWRAELRWWERVGDDAAALLGRADQATVPAAVALLGADAERTARALEIAAAGSGSELLGVFDGSA